jgi:hypothetical protein
MFPPTFTPLFHLSVRKMSKKIFNINILWFEKWCLPSKWSSDHDLVTLFNIKDQVCLLLRTTSNALYCLKKSVKIRRIRKSKDRQHTGHKKKDKRTNNDLQTGEPLYFIYLLISLRQSPHCHCHRLQHAN